MQALVDAVSGRYDIPQRWYTLKAQLLGVDRLADYDRMASVGERRGGDRLGRGDASSCSTRTRRSRPSSPTSRERFFDERGSTRRSARASGRARSARTPCRRTTRTCCSTGRRAGATCSRSRTSSATACTRTCAREQGVFHQSTPLTLAETASVFGETVTFGRLLDGHVDPAERLALLAANLEDQIATVFRQIAMNRFEDAVHTAAARRGRAVGRATSASCGSDRRPRCSATRSRSPTGYRTWWSYIPHFIGTPGLRVRVRVRPAARAVGVRALRGARAPTSCRSTSTCCAPGGSKSPEELGAIVGVDLADPGLLGRRPRHHRRAARGGRGRGEGGRPPQ